MKLANRFMVFNSDGEFINQVTFKDETDPEKAVYRPSIMKSAVLGEWNERHQKNL